MAKKQTREVPLAGNEVMVMQRLSQAAAAWLVGVDARVLRDHAVPRDADGKYDAREVVKCFKGRQSDPTFNDEEAEKMQNVVEHMVVADAITGPIFRYLRSLDDDCGDAGLAEFVRRLIGHAREMGLTEPKPEPNEADIRAEVERVLAEKRNQRAIDRLEIATVCIHCGKLRRGKRWTKSKPPVGHHVFNGECPDCEYQTPPKRRSVSSDPTDL